MKIYKVNIRKLDLTVTPEEVKHCDMAVVVTEAGTQLPRYSYRDNYFEDFNDAKEFCLGLYEERIRESREKIRELEISKTKFLTSNTFRG